MRSPIASMTLAALAALAPAAGGGHGQESVRLVFAPREGRPVAKRFQVEIEVGVEQLSIRGLDVLEPYLDWAGLSLPLCVTSELGVVDEYGPVVCGKPLFLARSFDDLRTAWGGWRMRREVLNPFLYRTVEFRWQAEEGKHGVRWQGTSRERAPLKQLYEDLDLRRLLPDAERPQALQVGARWCVPLARLAPVLMPAGDVHRDEELWSRSGLEAAQRRFAERLRIWVRNVDGGLECELLGVREDAGQRLADVRIDACWQLDEDVSGALDEWLGQPLDGALLSLDVRGEGRLVWDLSEAHFRAFELGLEADYRFTVELAHAGRLEAVGRLRAVWTAQASSGDRFPRHDSHEEWHQ